MIFNRFLIVAFLMFFNFGCQNEKQVKSIIEEEKSNSDDQTVVNPSSNEKVSSPSSIIEDEVSNAKSSKIKGISFSKELISLKDRFFPTDRFHNSGGEDGEFLVFKEQFDSLFRVSLKEKSILTSLPLDFNGPNGVVRNLNQLIQIKDDQFFLGSTNHWFILNENGKVVIEINPNEVAKQNPLLQGFDLSLPVKPFFYSPKSHSILVYAFPQRLQSVSDIQKAAKTSFPLVWEVSLYGLTIKPLPINYPEEWLSLKGSKLINSFPYLFVADEFILLSERINFSTSLYDRNGLFKKSFLVEKNKEIPIASNGGENLSEDVSNVVNFFFSPFGGSPSIYHADAKLFLRTYWFRKENVPIEKHLVAWDNNGEILWDVVLPNYIKPQPILYPGNNLVFLPIEPESDDVFVFYKYSW